MARKVCTPENLGAAIKEILQEYNEDVRTETKAIIKDVGRKTKKAIRSDSRAYGWSDYSRGWTTNYRTRKDYFEGRVHNKTHYQLAHLLEYGHQIVVHGRRLNKRTRAFPHFEKNEKKAYAEAYKRIKRVM